MSTLRDITIPTSAPSAPGRAQDRPQTNPRHPRGLTVLATTELWERFSFYGMQALLMLYMTTRLVPLAGHGGVWGWLELRKALQTVLGPLSDQAYASQIFGLYTGLVYLTPLAGGLLGDRLLGRRQTVLLGGALMALGHFLLAVEAAFLPALLLLILGSGCLKGNIATQVGALYAPADRRRDRAYLLFNLGINLGAFAGPLVCGVLGEQGNWHWGFAMAGLGMLVGLAIYVTGWRHLPRDIAMAPPSAETPPPPIRAAGSACCWRWWRSLPFTTSRSVRVTTSSPCGSMLPPIASWAALPSRSRGIWPPTGWSRCWPRRWW